MPSKTASCVLAFLAGLTAHAQPTPVLTWIASSSVKQEKIIGDVDWAAGSNYDQPKDFVLPPTGYTGCAR